METADSKVSTSSNNLPASDFHEIPDIKYAMDNPPLSSDRRLFNPRDLNESDRTTMIQETVEKAVSMESKHTVDGLLSQIRQLSPIEKLLLYLKLPNGRSSVDPLRQTLNPLGSRLEIHHTITWIKTHLQEDPEVSLPKQDVYEQYLDFCQGNSVKPLSTADFGKVMKQVYPNVRPRRLGTRGHSRYCYAGLRKRMRLAPPLLPDIGPCEKTSLEENNGGKVGSPERTLLVAVSVLIREWAGKSLGLRFSNLQDLACHLVQSMSVNVQSTAALTVLSSLNTPAPRSAGPSRPTSSAASLGSEGRPPSSCSAGPSRPASETPRSCIERDHKRKSQEDLERLQVKSGDNKLRGKRTKQHRSSSSPQESSAVGGRRSVANKGMATMANPNCDNSVSSQAFSGVPYASTKNGQQDVQNNNTLLSNGTAFETHAASMNSMYADSLVPIPSETSSCSANLGRENYMPSQRLDVGPDGKLPIPRLPKPNNKPAVPNYMNTQFTSPCMQQPQHQSPVTTPKQKYKPIKPKPNMDDSLVLKNESDPSKQLTSSADQNGTLKAIVPSRKGGNEAIIGCLEKDALDDYLHGGSNSQEQEEELMQYFPQQNQPSQNQSMQVDIPPNSFDQISQLRLLLERNMTQDMSNKTPQYQNGLSAAASLSLLSQRSQQKQGLTLPSLLNCQQNSPRRVSFDVPVEPDSATSSVPPSPNTKQRFSFTPISPRPYSPTKSSSANASPFVSPRNTPIPRRMSTQPTTTFMQSASSAMYSGKSMHKGNLPRTIMRSMSVNSEACPMASFQSVHHRSFVATTKPMDVSQMNMDVKPDIHSLQALSSCNDSLGNAFSSGWNPPLQSLTTALPPLQMPRSQYQVSMSAPQSPVVHNSKPMKKNAFNFRKETRAHSFDMESSHLLMPSADFKNQSDFLPCQSGPQVQNLPDKYSQEVSELFPEEDVMMPHLSIMTCASNFRSQSVPLRRMVNSVAVSPMSATALPSPHYGPPPTQHGFFNFNTYTPTSSVAPTPVPSEIADFGVESDGIHSSASGLQGLELMRDDLGDCNTPQGGMTAESLNPDLLHEMFSMFEEGKNEVQQASQDFPQTPEQYKPDPETSLRGDPLFSSFRLQAVGSECGSCTEEQLSLSGTQSAAATSADPILNELNNITTAETAQPGMDSLLEEAPSSFMTEDLECEISQLTREVGNSTSQ